MKPYAELFAALVAMLLLSVPACAQSIPPLPLECVIQQISLPNHSARITCLTSASLGASPGASPGKLAVRFPDEFAGIDRLSDRIYSIKAVDAQQSAMPVEIRGNGLYLINISSAGQMQLSYEIRLARALDPSQYALISSLGQDAGIFMMGDMIPRICVGDENCTAPQNILRLKIDPPAGWEIVTTEQREGDAFQIADSSRAIFFLGHIRESTAKIGRMNLRITIAGEWGFQDPVVFSLAESIAREQAALIGGNEQGDFLVTLAPFPQPLTGLRSSAVTIEHTVILLLNPNTDAKQSFKHYCRHLAHEMFHFYLPNAFRIRENFDWFWEGFTRYVALMTLARLRLIDLPEYLNAINAEYEAYVFNPLRSQLSLVKASPDKFANTANYDLIYRKGMLVAALYDLQLRWQSHNRLNLADVMKALYQKHALTGREIGNQEVLREIESVGDFTRLIQDDILGVQPINLAERIKVFGLVIKQNPATPGRLQLIQSAKLSARQRNLISNLAENGH